MAGSGSCYKFQPGPWLQRRDPGSGITQALCIYPGPDGGGDCLLPRPTKSATERTGKHRPLGAGDWRWFNRTALCADDADVT